MSYFEKPWQPSQLIPPPTRARRHAFSVGIAAAAKRITVRFVHVPGCQRGKKNKHKKKEGKDEEGEEERKRPRHRRMRENKDIAQSGELLGSTLRSLKCLFDARERWQLFMCILCTCYFPHVCLCLCVCLVCRRGEERRGGGWRLESPEKQEVFSLAQPEDECVGVVKSPSTRLREQQQLV